MLINENYYKQIIKKYLVHENSCATVEITMAAIVENYRTKIIHFNFPKDYCLEEVINLLYENFSKKIFSNFADITDFSIGDKFKNNRRKGKDVFEIISIQNNKYTLKNIKATYDHRVETSFENLKRNYTQIKQSTRTATIQSFINYFKPVNKYGFTPQFFTKKLVLIAGQTIWNCLKNKNCIPTIYFPNTREDIQTRRHSIEAFEDSITYITPKYTVCYEEFLKTGTEIDTIIVCGTDLSSIPQIISDKSKYNFNLVILSNEDAVPQINGVKLWNWQKEEIDLLEKRKKTRIEFDCITEEDLDNHIQHFEESVKYVSGLKYPITLNSYGYFLRLALNAIQDDQFEYLLMRLKRNKELEQNDGGYEDFNGKNPKEALSNLILYLKSNNPKYNALQNYISNISTKALIVVDRENFEALNSNHSNSHIIVTNGELKNFLKSSKIYSGLIVFSSFNGSKDFNFIYNLTNPVKLILYKAEENLYLKQLQKHKKQLEEELTSIDRTSICGIKYEPIVETEVTVNPTLEQIIAKLEERSDLAYENYKNEGDSLLDDLDEEITYEITMSNDEIWRIESNETVYDCKGNLIKAYKLKSKDKIRIYPREQLASNLFQIAVDVEPDSFGKIDEDSNLWKNELKKLDSQINNRELLYQKLKEKGLRVLPTTVDSYFSGNRKFPMFNSDLGAILSLANKLYLFPEIIKSKRLYNSTMIALGRGIKQELQQFLQNNTIGEILQKKNFTVETLQKFLDKEMQLLTIINIEEVNDE